MGHKYALSLKVKLNPESKPFHKTPVHQKREKQARKAQIFLSFLATLHFRTLYTIALPRKHVAMCHSFENDQGNAKGLPPRTTIHIHIH